MNRPTHKIIDNCRMNLAATRTNLSQIEKILPHLAWKDLISLDKYIRQIEKLTDTTLENF